MRGLSKFAAAANTAPGRPAAAAATLAAYSTFSGSGGGGGRGRGRGSGDAPPPQPTRLSRVLGQYDPVAADDEDDHSAPPGLGHGRGRPLLPSSPVLPAFSSWMSSLKSSPDLGRGRGRGAPPPSGTSDAGSLSKRPIFLKWEDGVAAPGDKPQVPEEVSPLPGGLSSTGPGVGRGKPSRPVEPGPRVVEENRHVRRRTPPPSSGAGTSSQTRMGQEEAVKKAMEVLSRGGPDGGRGRGMNGRRGGGRRISGRGPGGRSNRGEADDADANLSIYLGDSADGEKLKKRLGEEKMKELSDQFDEMSFTALPSPLDDAYLDALHTNNMIEYEPEYLVDFDNPDIDEKPPMPLIEALEKAKPFLMAYEGIQSQEEWEEAVKEVMERLPHMKELMDMYCGPDRVTAKQQQQELERVAKTLPENIPSSVKRFTDRVLLSLQSNPGWGFDKKCQFMDKLAWEVSQHYKY